MELPRTVEWSLHTAWLLAQLPDGAALPGHRIAEYYGLPRPYLSKSLKAMTRRGLLAATTGPGGGYRLARAAESITALDVVHAIDGDRPVFHCAEIRQRGPVPASAAACRQPCGIAQVMGRAEQAWRDELAATTIADLVANVGPAARKRAVAWLASVTTPAEAVA